MNGLEIKWLHIYLLHNPVSKKRSCGEIKDVIDDISDDLRSPTHILDVCKQNPQLVKTGGIVSLFTKAFQFTKTLTEDQKGRYPWNIARAEAPKKG